MKINLPAHFSLFDKIGKDYVYQLGFEQTIVDGTIEEYSFNRVQGYVLKIDGGREILISPKKDWSAHDRFEHILFVTTQVYFLLTQKKSFFLFVC